LAEYGAWSYRSVAGQLLAEAAENVEIYSVIFETHERSSWTHEEVRM